MPIVLHRADSHGHADHGWLDMYHTFSFASYYNPERMSFGLLRVLNDDTVAGGRGFPPHPHDNMEIVSIPLRGDLEHKDSMGNIQVIRQGDVQIMSAGTGVRHSEYNHSKSEPVNFLQLWVMPGKRNIEPRYAQRAFPAAERHNRPQTVVSGNPDAAPALWINQDAAFALGSLDAGATTGYRLRSGDHGVYLFVLEGEVRAGAETLKRRDGLGTWGTEAIEIEALGPSEILLVEVPMG